MDCQLRLSFFESASKLLYNKIAPELPRAACVLFGECTIWRMNHLANVPFGECTIWLLHKNKVKIKLD
jgi:hypothetical protein